MKPPFSTQLWVAAKIWLLAVIANTVLGSMYLVSFFEDPSILGMLIVYGIFFGGLFSFPVMILLTIVINRCVAKNVNGIWIFRIVFLVGLAATTGIWFLFNIEENLSIYKEDLGLALISLLSGMIAIAVQYKSLYFLGRKDNELERFLEKIPNGES